MKKIFIVLLIGMFFTSCVPKKNLTYFRGEPKVLKEIHKIQQVPYRLQVNDIIDVKIKSISPETVALFQNEAFGSSELRISPSRLYFESYSVDSKGMVRIPYLGDINVLGYTTKEVRIKIETELSKMFRDVNDLFVNVKLAGIRYTILGEVRRTGVNVLYQNQVTIFEAIANAGDIITTGDRKKVTVIRQNMSGIKKYQMDLTGFDYVNNEGYYIQPNDIISIEPLAQKTWGTGTTFAGSMSTIVSALSLLTTIIILNRNFNL